MKSLRGQLVFFWVLLLGMCAALAVVMFTLYRSSAGAQVAARRAATEQSCRGLGKGMTVSRIVPAAASSTAQSWPLTSHFSDQDVHASSVR